jgi:hypothetical protein
MRRSVTAVPGRSSTQFRKYEAGPIVSAIFIPPALVAIDRSNTYEHARHGVGMVRRERRFRLNIGASGKWKTL